jgi:hypothetical protein
MGLTKVLDFSKAKLLKEKGFDNVCYSYYENERLYKGPFGTTIINSEYGSRPSVKEILNSDFELKCYKIRKKEYVAAPTIAEVVMWLYEKHNLWVEVYPRKYNIMKLMWSYSIVAIKEGYTVDMEFPDIERIEEIPTWEEPTEAYEAAIEYTLKNLI